MWLSFDTEKTTFVWAPWGWECNGNIPLLILRRMYHIVAYLQVGVYHIVAYHDRNSSKNGLPEHVGYANCIEYKIKICHKYFTIPVWIKTKGMKLPSSTFGFIKSYVICKICVIDWQSYPSLCDTLFSVYSMIRHYGFYPKRMIRHYVIHPTT